MKIPTMKPTGNLPPMILFDDCKKGETSAKTGCTPQEGGGGKGKVTPQYHGPMGSGLPRSNMPDTSGMEKMGEFQEGEVEAYVVEKPDSWFVTAIDKDSGFSLFQTELPKDKWSSLEDAQKWTEGRLGEQDQDSEDSSPKTSGYITKETSENLPVAGKKVSGLFVRNEIPNLESIGASLDEYEVLSGVRSVPISDWEIKDLHDLYYSADDIKRAKDLAEEIKESGEISPLIVVVDDKGAYVLEGGHRIGALHLLDVEELPALVVIDNDEKSE